ncbi:DUF4190 domain-containing protein [Clostridium sp. E02]|uniref:DUF4190 domain-containing protein n=1 Tax=Clostridium sp. E02 TaxID=2487134 RepID=UPI000F52D571|nr:DUF4190 domain-containing protein [Clostridium sp. E02]
MDENNQIENNQIENNQMEENQPDPLPLVEPEYNKHTYEQPQETQNNMALASLVMGIIGIVTSCCCYGGLIFGSLGILFALLSRTEGRFDKYAKAGLITSIIAFALVIVVIFAAIFLSLVRHIGGIYE